MMKKTVLFLLFVAVVLGAMEARAELFVVNPLAGGTSPTGPSQMTWANGTLTTWGDATDVQWSQ